MLAVKELRCNHQKHPLGVTGTPVFSWKMESSKAGTWQTAYRLILIRGKEIAFDSGKVDSPQSVDVSLGAIPLLPGTEYSWNVKAWDNYGQEAEANSHFETAPEKLLAQWIEPSIPSVCYEKPIPLMANMILKAKPTKPVDKRLLPVTLLRKEFTVRPGLVRARAYATAHGVYSLYFNGSPSDQRLFAPEFTSYQKILYYQTYDVTALLFPGANACGAMLADGWWAGRIGVGGECGQYGRSRAFLLQIDLHYEDGSRETVLSDQSFTCSNNGPIRYSDIFIGEKQDHAYTETIERFSRAGYNADSWQPVLAAQYDPATLRPQIGDPVVRRQELKAVKLFTTPKGETVIDFGQTFAGFVRLKTAQPRGTVIKLEHSEVLDEKGNFLNNIIGVNKEQTDILVCSGEGTEEFEPCFTFHGFRYVKVSGMKSPVAEAFTGVVISSEMDDLISFESSNPLLNKLYANTRWSQLSNMISIPTDCPQRERAGWLGDIQVYAPTAAYFQDMNAFLSRWLENVESDQLEDGQIPCVVPYSESYQKTAKMQGGDSSAGWSEACIVVPYTLFKMYGNQTILKQCYPMMQRWMAYVQDRAANHNPKGIEKNKNLSPRELDNYKYLWNTGWHYGDWMIPSLSKGPMGGVAGAKKTKELFASLYYAYAAGLMTEISALLGKPEAEKQYAELSRRVKEAIAETYISEDGRITPDLQGSYVCALWLGVVPKDREYMAVARLNALIQENGYRLDTGFLATPVLLDVLMKYDLKETAYRLLYQEECPSWFYEIKKGATTLWESWDGIQPNGKVGSLSYNHYAFGSVCHWIFRFVGGIRPLEPGFRKILIQPEPDSSLTQSRCVYQSVYGEIGCAWIQAGQRFTMKVTIPCNTSAIVVLPDGTEHEVESGVHEFSCG